MMALRLTPYRSVRGLMNSPTMGIFGTAATPSEQVRTLHSNRHMDPKFRNLRRLKMGLSAPNKYNKNEDLAVKEGYLQSIPIQKKLWVERDLFISGSNSIVEEFVPPENLGKAITEEMKKRWNDIGNFGKDKLSMRKIRGFESEFNIKVFLEESKEVYIKAHELLAQRDYETLTDYVTEHARVAMLHNASTRTIRWKFLEMLEPPKAVQVRAFQLDENNNMFAQIIVRMVSQQCLAVYDRFGRLLYGSEVLAKDVLEYVVFEKHLSNEYGVWRVHDKIIPNDRVRMAEHTFVSPKKAPEETSVVSTGTTEAPAESAAIAN